MHRIIDLFLFMYLSIVRNKTGTHLLYLIIVSDIPLVESIEIVSPRENPGIDTLTDT